MEGTFGQSWVQLYLDLEMTRTKYSKGDCLVCVLFGELNHGRACIKNNSARLLVKNSCW